ncbi:glycosyltransferase [Nocardioides pocheonensis]|uniref:Glycosyltransferase n=1 Tax=Nocardioides pocheonensis TaxID=661485 RepID=A0A3N0GYH4_9ACTN|nr:glycosyltransferase [Nocardioides pocheonensis]RNM17517.1 glycosyltransferase [Nocardioides pocheonensis]
MNQVRASVLIPTYDHASTLPLTVESVLRQSVADLEALIVGDGVTPEARAAIEPLVESDPRIRFLDFPKGPHHGEIHRHQAVLEARSDAIFYLCDDDLLLPEHVADLLALLEEANFVQSRNGFFTPDGRVGMYPTDLGDPGCVAWALGEPRRNMTSITGTAHSRRYYLEVGDHWETTPEGEWPDHYQWKKYFRRADFRGATSSRMTALQFPTSGDGRDAWTPEERQAELERWAALVAAPDGQERIDAMVDRSTQIELAHTYRDLGFALDKQAELRVEIADLEERLEAAETRLERVEAALQRRKRQVARLRGKVATMQRSHSWRVTAPLRAARARVARDRSQ